MGKSFNQLQIVQFVKRHPLVLLLLLALLQTGAVLLFLRRPSSPAQSTSQSASEAASPAPSASSPASPSTSPIPLAKATKTATKFSAPAAASPSPQPKPTLTVEQQALNQQYKKSFTNSGSSVDSLIEMRVAIAEGVPAISLGSSTPATLMDQDRKPIRDLAAGTRYAAQPNGSGISLNSAQFPQLIIVEPSNDGLIYLGDRVYRGRLLLVNDSGKLWAVNLINLRSYLHSVVASEVSSSWPAEALKAQAVAARSYALTYHFKPVSSLFDLGATEYYQVYSGIEREAPTSNQAVDATAGEFVSYRGGIVESLYAASDDIVAEAFRGHGMSQLGALNLAEQGYKYQQILANYYPSTGVGRIVQDYE